MSIQNPNCDGAGPCCLGEVRLLPVSKDPMQGNLILCRNCFQHEIEYRESRNLELAPEARFHLPKWETLSIYGS